MPSAFSGRIFDFTQPDGTPIRLRGWGNQFHAVFETLEGHTVVKDPASGFFRVAALSADGQSLQPTNVPAHAAAGALAGLPRGLRLPRAAALAAISTSPLARTRQRWEERREERRQERRALRSAAAAGGPLLAPPRRETVGDYLGLCLLIDFSDAPATIQREEVERFCNQSGYTGFGNRGSVHDYFLDNSIGRCRYTSQVLPYYRAQHPKTHYTDPSIPYPQRAIELIQEALAHHQALVTDFSGLTADDQGFIYAINVYYAGPVTNNWSEGLWPHSHHLASARQLAPGRSAFDYQFTAMGSELELGTFCHENGHMLCDYPDLYDYGYESSGVGAFCLMGSGNNRDEKNPISICAYLKRLAGWANTIQQLEHDRVVSLAAGSNDFAIFPRNGREYFILENRQRVNRDAALPDAGLAIWHVDEDGDNSNQEMTAAKHYEISLEQADGLFQLERVRGTDGDANDLYAGAAASFSDASTPDSRWWSGAASNLIIDRISASGPTMSFRVRTSDVEAPPSLLTKKSTPARAIPDDDLDGISDRIVVDEDVQISAVRVDVDITHTYRGDLQVMLATPWGSEIELKPQGSGGSADNLKASYDAAAVPALATLRAHGSKGPWTLTVRDRAQADTGRLNAWSLQIASVDAPVDQVELSENPGAAIPDHPAPGIERTLNVAQEFTVGSVEVDVDIAHSWVGDLRLTLVSPGGRQALLQDQIGGGQRTLTRTFAAANTPSLAGLAGQQAHGGWKLKVQDVAARDDGKLKSWKLRVRRG